MECLREDICDQKDDSIDGSQGRDDELPEVRLLMENCRISARAKKDANGDVNVVLAEMDEVLEGLARWRREEKHAAAAKVFSDDASSTAPCGNAKDEAKERESSSTAAHPTSLKNLSDVVDRALDGADRLQQCVHRSKTTAEKERAQSLRRGNAAMDGAAGCSSAEGVAAADCLLAGLDSELRCREIMKEHAGKGGGRSDASACALSPAEALLKELEDELIELSSDEAFGYCGHRRRHELLSNVQIEHKSNPCKKS